jgi:hypothetical protein
MDFTVIPSGAVLQAERGACPEQAKRVEWDLPLIRPIA